MANNLVADDRRWIDVDPARQGGEPCLNGTRITTEEVATWWWSGMSLDDMVYDWPDLNHAAILTCCWYQARYGSRVWRKRWRDWLPEADLALYRCQQPITEIALPPQRPTAEQSTDEGR